MGGLLPISLHRKIVRHFTSTQNSQSIFKIIVKTQQKCLHILWEHLKPFPSDPQSVWLLIKGCFARSHSSSPGDSDVRKAHPCSLLTHGVCIVALVMSDSLQPRGLEPAGHHCPWASLGENTGVGCHTLLQGIFPTQGSNPGLWHRRQILYPLRHLGSPFTQDMFSKLSGSVSNNPALVFGKYLRLFPIYPFV